MEQRSGWKSSKFQGAIIGAVLLSAVFIFIVLRTGVTVDFHWLCASVVTLLGGYQATRVLESLVALKGGVLPKPEAKSEAP